MSKDYSPNHIPRAERFINVVYSLALIALGGVGLWSGKLLLPGRRIGGPNGLELGGLPAWAMYGAMLCACLVMLSVIVDHYDRRDNEINYRRFAQTFKFIGWALFVASLALYAFGVGA